MGRFTIQLLRRLDPESRLLVAVYLFWSSILGGVYSCIWVASTAYEKILMGISWGAITITAVDVVVTSDVRAEQSEGDRGESNPHH
jgi:hypothetical protein